jgi:ACS family tartrate transporter-like MFS transporter
VTITKPAAHTERHLTGQQDPAALVARIRWRLIPFMFLLYIVAYLDRVNIGFASLQMNDDLGLSASVYGFGAGIFFIGYFLFEVPSNLIMERVGARIWIARIMITWGLISAGMMFTRGPASFYLLRFLLGVAEAGFFPGMILYLTYWFPAAERARAVALFMTANATAGIVGGPVSGALLSMHGTGGLAGWQWLFLLEGIPAIVLGVIVLAYLPNGPDDARWLTDAERLILQARLAADHAGRTDVGHTTLQVLRDGRVWVFSLLYFALVVSLYGVSFWLPQILKSLSGSSNLVVGVLSACPFIVAAIGMVWIGRHSDRHRERRWHVAIPALAGALGLVLSGLISQPAVALASLSLAALGIWGALGPFWAMPTSLLAPSAAAAGIAWINSVGNLGGFVGPSAIGFIKDATGGFGAAMGALAASLVAAAVIALRAPDRD